MPKYVRAAAVHSEILARQSGDLSFFASQLKAEELTSDEDHGLQFGTPLLDSLGDIATDLDDFSGDFDILAQEDADADDERLKVLPSRRILQQLQHAGRLTAGRQVQEQCSGVVHRVSDGHCIT